MGPPRDEFRATGTLAGEASRSRFVRGGMRYLVAALGLLVLVGALGGLKGAQIATLVAAGKQFQKAGPPPETVSTFVAQEQTWDRTLSVVGSIAAGRGVTVSNDAPGILLRIAFESGETVRERQVLAEIDSRVERAQLRQSLARLELAEVTYERTRRLVETAALSPAQLDSDRAALDGARADVAGLQAQIERKIVRAPFAGKLGIRLVNVGQYLPPGTPITALESPQALFVDFSLPQQDLSLLHVGTPVRLTGEAGDGGAGPPSADAAITAIDPTVDPATRNIKVRGSVPPDDPGLRPGMFVHVEVVLPGKLAVVTVPATAIVHAAYGDSVFVVENGTARQQFVRLGAARGDFVAIADGVKAGQEVVVGGAFKLRNGTRVAVNNEVQPHPELAPHPENR